MGALHHVQGAKARVSTFFPIILFFFLPLTSQTIPPLSLFLLSPLKKHYFIPFFFCSPLPLSLSFLCITSLLFPPHFSLFIYLFQSYSLLGFSLDLSLSLSLSLPVLVEFYCTTSSSSLFIFFLISSLL